MFTFNGYEIYLRKTTSIMSDNTNKKDSGWIGVILVLLFIVCGLAFMLPFNLYINILIAIVVVAISVGGIYRFID